MTERQRDRRYDQLREAVSNVVTETAFNCAECKAHNIASVNFISIEEKSALLKLIDKAQAAGVEIE